MNKEKSTQKESNSLFRRLFRFITNTCCYCGKGKIVMGNRIDFLNRKLQVYKCNKCGMTGF